MAKRRASIGIVPKRRCHAHSSQTGEPCKNYAIVGGKVCFFHGGAAPHVRKAAQERLAAPAEDALGVVMKIAGLRYNDPETGELVHWQHDRIDTMLRAAIDLLDRAGYKPTDLIEISDKRVTNEALDEAIAAALAKRAQSDAS